MRHWDGMGAVRYSCEDADIGIGSKGDYSGGWNFTQARQELVPAGLLRLSILFDQ
jgi:hypothetical protein